MTPPPDIGQSAIIARIWCSKGEKSAILDGLGSNQTFHGVTVLMGMSEIEASAFLERVGATAIVNQAILKCTLAGLPITHDNIICCIGDFVDPTNPATAGLVRHIQRSIEEIMEAATRRNSTLN